jgi:hypothetical protein
MVRAPFFMLISGSALFSALMSDRASISLYYISWIWGRNCRAIPPAIGLRRMWTQGWVGGSCMRLLPLCLIIMPLDPWYEGGKRRRILKICVPRVTVINKQLSVGLVPSQIWEGYAVSSTNRLTLASLYMQSYLMSSLLLTNRKYTHTQANRWKKGFRVVSFPGGLQIGELV